MTGRIGVLTAGGDAPGLNAAIRAVVRAAASRYGFEVVDLVAEGGFGQMVALQGDRIGTVPLTEASKVRPVPAELIAAAELFFEDPPEDGRPA